MIFEIIQENNLEEYYSLSQTPGRAPENGRQNWRYEYLDNPSIRQELIDFDDGTLAKTRFSIPAIHCSSCIWLLENMSRLDSGIVRARVDFLRKEIAIDFASKRTSLRRIVELLASIGYEPDIQPKNPEGESIRDGNRTLYIKIGVAGFCFGNVMLFSLPEYLGLGHKSDSGFQLFFGYLNILLALPVFFYSASGFFVSAFRGLSRRMINIDLPISLGVTVLFARSLFEIASGTGPGFMDSFTCLVFLLLLGRLFQRKTYDALSFDRDYKSYFPISVTVIDKHGDKSVPLAELKKGDSIRVHNHGLVPADSVLTKAEALIDYSFVTGEALPVAKAKGELIFAGGRQIGPSIELTTVKEVSQSYLTRLWSNKAFDGPQEGRITALVNLVVPYFTVAVLLIAAAATLYWANTDLSMAVNAFTSVLIVACPCALALSTPFTLGNILRLLGRNHFYLKHTGIVESLARTDTVVFDKTGTLTQSVNSNVRFVPIQKDSGLTHRERQLVKSLAGQSTHPLSVMISDSLNSEELNVIEDYSEVPGQGIQGTIDGNVVALGTGRFAGMRQNKTNLADQSHTTVYLAIDGKMRGFFLFSNKYRPGLKAMLSRLKDHLNLWVLSGDNESERSNLINYFGNDSILYFNQSPDDKLSFVEELQTRGKNVVMIGDGLNDAGALKKSDVGVAVVDDLSQFSPSCDAILKSSRIENLADYLRFSRMGMAILYVNFGISFFYNLIGLSFAVQGTLSPLIAAILMPISSISIIVVSVGVTNLLASRLGLMNGDGKS